MILKLFLHVRGRLNQLEASNDEVFATKTLGEGFFVRASENQIFAPVSGIITSVFPTKHAIGIRSENGMEIMLHIGVDTVRVKKRYYRMFVGMCMMLLKRCSRFVKSILLHLKNWGYYLMCMYLLQTVANITLKM